MAGGSTKKLKVELKSALKSGFAERGWRPQRGDATTFVAPEAVVGPPLDLSWSSNIDSHKFGGVRLTGSASVRCAAVTETILSFDPLSRPADFDHFPGDEYAAMMLTIDWVSAGALVDPVKRNYHNWIVQEEPELPTAVTDFFAMVDGPLTEWAAGRTTPEAILRRHSRAEADDPARRNSTLVRTLATLALLHGEVDEARRIVAGYDASDSDADRVARFERELAGRFPEYGSAQLTSG